jgi:hypothetical protein
MLFKLAFVSLVLGLAQAQSSQTPCLQNNFYGFKVDRKPTDDLASIGSTHPECSAIYTVTLDEQYTTQGNDIGMLPPHGIDNRFPKSSGGTYPGKDYTNEPFANDPVKQAAARAKFSVTALTELTGRCSTEDAYPLGFKSDTIRAYHAVCVSVRNVHDRWLEIMAASYEQDNSICVEDWDRTPRTQTEADSPPQISCGQQNIYTCRESGNLIGQDEVNVKFYCRENCEETAYDFHWRIVASDVQKDGVSGQADGEDWCGYRKGDDYPLTLLNPYPDQYSPPPVFDASTGSASTAGMSMALVFLVLGALLACLA